MYSRDISTTTYLYVLDLAHGCLYVGVTTCPARRLRQHREGGADGAAWTRLHPPLPGRDFRVLRPVEGSPGLDEDKETKEWMRRYGIDKVRGGAYAAPTLTAAQVDTLKHEMNHADGNCLRCGRPGHMARACPQPREPNKPKPTPTPTPRQEERSASVPISASQSCTALAMQRARARARRAPPALPVDNMTDIVPMEIG